MDNCLLRSGFSADSSIIKLCLLLYLLIFHCKVSVFGLFSFRSSFALCSLRHTGVHFISVTLVLHSLNIESGDTKIYFSRKQPLLVELTIPDFAQGLN